MKRSVKIFLNILICLFLIGCENNTTSKKDEQIKIDYGQIDIEILRKSFSDINETHEQNFKEITKSYSKKIIKITYEKDNLLIESIVNAKNNQIYFYENYNPDTKKLDNLKVHLPNDNKDIVKEIVTKISLMSGLNASTKDANDIEEYLLNGTPTVDNCLEIGNYCISKSKTDLLDTYMIEIK